METTIDPAGKVEIPREILEKLHLAPGMPLIIEMCHNEIVLKPMPDDPNLKYVSGGLVYTGAVFPKDVDPVEQMREERIQELLRRFNGKDE